MSTLPLNPSESVRRRNPGLFLNSGAPVNTAARLVRKVGEDHPVNLKHVVTTDEDKLNKTEKRFLSYLRAGHCGHIGIQNVTLKLAHDCRLTPDFNYPDTDGIIFIDVKGFQREDALIKMKVAARLFLWAKFAIVKERKGGAWDFKWVKP